MRVYLHSPLERQTYSGEREADERDACYRSPHAK